MAAWMILPYLNLYQSFGHYSDGIMSAMASEISGVPIVHPTVCSGADQRKHQSSASLVFVRRIHRCPVNSLHKVPVTGKYFHLMASSCGIVAHSIHNIHV